MKTIIAGSRSITDILILGDALLHCPWKITHVVSGCAAGPDRLGEHYASAAGLPVTRMAANWLEDGRGAGMIRNKQMADVSEALVALWDGSSKGTHQMMQIALKRKMPTVVYDLGAGTIGVLHYPDEYVIEFPVEPPING